MTERMKRVWNSPERVNRLNAIIGIIMVALIIGIGWLGFIQSQGAQGRLRDLAEAQALTGFASRQQQRCVAWEAQATLRGILLASPDLTPQQIEKVKALVPLPALRVRNGDGTVFVLDCDKFVRQAVPGLPQGLDR